MNILYDNQVFTWQKFGGISRYFYELIKNLDEDIRYRLPLCVSNNQYILQKDISNHFQFFPNKEFKGKIQIMTQANKAAFRFAKKSDVNLIHPTYYDPYFLNYIGNKPFVLTVYDMIHEKYSELFKHDTATTRNKRLVCEKASKIIAISENTKKDLIDIFNINPQKIEVIYLGQSFSNYAEDIENLPERYILFTGQRGGYKNFVRFVKAFAQIISKDKDLKLICTGSPFSKEELAFLKEEKVDSAVQHTYVTDAQLTTLYKKALLFAFPSEYEGFGIPVLEAFSCGCPIALSDASSFPEVAGKAGVYFDPTDIDSISESLEKLLYSELLREEKIQEGYTQLNKFSWAKMGQETSLLYKTLGV